MTSSTSIEQAQQARYEVINVISADRTSTAGPRNDVISAVRKGTLAVRLRYDTISGDRTSTAGPRYDIISVGRASTVGLRYDVTGISRDSGGLRRRTTPQTPALSIIMRRTT